MRSDRLLWVLLLGLLGAVVVLAVNHEQGEVAGIGLGQFARLVALGSIGIFVAAMSWRMFRGRLHETLVAALFWMVIAVLLALAYTYRAPLQAVGQRVMGELMPGYAVQRSDGRRITVEVTRARDGQFAVNASINGAGVAMLVDTGASTVVLAPADAQAAGLDVGGLSYNVAVDTANGRTQAAPVVLDTVIVGGIVERRVPALVSAPGALRTSLLGLSFLSRLDAFEFKGDRLVLRGPAAR